MFLLKNKKHKNVFTTLVSNNVFCFHHASAQHNYAEQDTESDLAIPSVCPSVRPSITLTG